MNNISLNSLWQGKSSLETLTRNVIKFIRKPSVKIERQTLNQPEELASKYLIKGHQNTLIISLLPHHLIR